MILTVTANVAIDRTYVVDHLQVGAVHKVRRVYAHTGGKGVNVSRCVQSLGGDTLATGLIGRPGFDEATLDLADAGIRCSLFAVDAPPRQTVTVTAQDGTTTAFDELGPTVASDDWADFERARLRAPEGRGHDRDRRQPAARRARGVTRKPDRAGEPPGGSGHARRKGRGHAGRAKPEPPRFQAEPQ